ncbi:MAG TPA: tetratricopeptide repeat protein [Enhygromyxa sp.]|nr:tetratricopeptide repeat protein [Enhygromyxa sp.]
MRILPATLVCVCACSAREAPPPQTHARSAPVVQQGRPAPADESAAFDVVDAQLRTGRTRVGEAVRLHVSAWRASTGPGFSPRVEVVGPATVERVGDEIIEEQDGRVRERVDFLIEPSAPGLVDLSVLTTAAASEPQRDELTLLIEEPLPAAELAKLLGSHAGRLERGRALAKQGDYRRAIEAFNLALEDRRDDPVVLGEVGWVAFLAGDQTLARRATREALRHQTDDPARGALLYNLGRIAEALGREDEALAAYRRSLEVRPDSPPVRARLARLEAGRPAPTCAAPSCPLTPPIDAIRTCELVEEEGCPLFRERSACSCDALALSKLDAIGPWRLLTLTERQDAGINHVYFLLAEVVDQADGESSYQVFAPLPGSHFHGELRGGVRAAERVEAGELELLRVDFEGAVDRSSLPEVGEPDDGLARGWTLLCTITDGGPVCAAPLLSRHQSVGELPFSAPVVIANGSVRQTIESGTAPSRGELDLEFPGAGMRVLTRPTLAAELLKHPLPASTSSQ